MSDILIFSNNNAEAVTDVLTSFGNKWSTSSRAFADESLLRDPSELKCIVVCFREDEINELDDSCEALKNFININQINSKIPIIPIVYNAESANSYTKNLRALFHAHDSLNFSKRELVWFKNESPVEFKNKFRKAEFVSGYALTQSLYADEDDLTGKNINLYEIVKWVFIVLGFIVGAIAGGLIGGLAIGGLVAALSGVAIGVVSGPIAGWLTARGFFGGSGAAAEKETENRSIVLQQRTESKERNQEWEIFEESFFSPNASSPMSPLLQSCRNEGPSGAVIPKTQENYQPIFRSVNTDKAKNSLSLVEDEARQDAHP